MAVLFIVAKKEMTVSENIGKLEAILPTGYLQSLDAQLSKGYFDIFLQGLYNLGKNNKCIKKRK